MPVSADQPSRNTVAKIKAYNANHCWFCWLISEARCWLLLRLLIVSAMQLSDQALAVQILAACIHACDVVSLLDRATGWGTQLTEALRRAVAAAADTASPAPEQLAAEGCRAAAVLFNRLHHHIELPGVRREVTSIVPKLLPQLLAVLQNTRFASSCQTTGLQMLVALLQCVPAALRSVASAVEKTLQQLVVQAASSVSSSTSPAVVAAQQQVLAEAAQCIALLPAAPGDAATWSETARRLLSSSHDVLDNLLMGLEGRPLDPQYRAYLAPATANGQQQQQGAASAGWFASLPWQQEQHQQQGAGRRQLQPARLLLGVCTSALQQLLQQPFAVPAPVPGYSLVLLAARLLLFDAAAAVAAGAVAASSTMYQELVVLQPQLQQAGWGLLQLVVAAAGHQLQLQGVLLRLVRQGLRSIQLSGYYALHQRPVAVRCYVYSTTSDVLRATGLAGVRGLSAEAVGCAVLEMYGHTAAAKSAGKSTGNNQAGVQRPAKRVRTSGAAGVDFEQFDPAASVASAAADSDVSRLTAAVDLQAQAAALHMLQQLLESGGQLLPAEVRAHADAVAFHMAQTAAAAALRLQQQPTACSVNCSGHLGAFQAAAYQALLASILVPCSSRPPFLSQALLLFREGKHSSHPAVTAVCQAATVQCEALLHPRAAAISSVKQYSGMEAVTSLSKPLLWSVADNTAGATTGAVAADKAPTSPAAAAALHSTAVVPATNQQQQQGQQQTLQQPSGISPTHNGLVVVGYPVTIGNMQQQPQQQQQEMPLQQQSLLLSKLTPATTAVAGAMPEASAAHTGVGAALQSQQRYADGAKQQQLQQQQQGDTQDAGADPRADGMEVDPQAALATVQPPLGVAVQGERGTTTMQYAAGAGLAGLPAAAAGQTGWQPRAAAAVFNEESSDSEGPLPELDSGSDSGDEESS